MFEVGKRYIDIDGEIAECVYISEGEFPTAVLERDDGSIFIEAVGRMDGWTEYKEPVTITRYAVVYTPHGEDNPTMLLYDTFTSEEVARKAFWRDHTIHQIIPVTATIEG